MQKPTPLTDLEIGLLRRHPLIAHDILAEIPLFEDAAPIVLSTQERFDGRGYPRGLAALEIPMSARVISLVDAFDLLTTGHPLGLRLSLAEACAELVRGAGMQFDPDSSTVAAAGRHVAPARANSWRVTPDSRRLLRHLIQQPRNRFKFGCRGVDFVRSAGEVCVAAEAYSLGRWRRGVRWSCDRCC